jgi:hypothetical protein
VIEAQPLYQVGRNATSLFQKQYHGNITISSGMDEVPLPPSRIPSHGRIIIMCGVQEIPGLNSRQRSNWCITSLSVAEKISLHPSRIRSHGSIITVWCGGDALLLSRRPIHGGITITSRAEKTSNTRTSNNGGIHITARVGDISPQLLILRRRVNNRSYI